MKPRITLAETRLPDGSTLALQEHDGRKYLLIHGQQICGPATRAAEEELARLACAPFRPARQPKICFAGLGLGHTLAAAATELPQKRATFIVAEPLADLPEWHRPHLPASPLLTDSRVGWKPTAAPPHSPAMPACSTPSCSISTPRPPARATARGWTTAAGSPRPTRRSRPAACWPSPVRARRRLTRQLQRAGFEVAEFTVPASRGEEIALAADLARQKGRAAD